MDTRGFFTDSIKGEVVTLMLTIQTEECKNCRLVFEETDIKRKFADTLNCAIQRGLDEMINR